MQVVRAVRFVRCARALFEGVGVATTPQQLVSLKVRKHASATRRRMHDGDFEGALHAFQESGTLEDATLLLSSLGERHIEHRNHHFRQLWERLVTQLQTLSEERTLNEETSLNEDGSLNEDKSTLKENAKLLAQVKLWLQVADAEKLGAWATKSLFQFIGSLWTSEQLHAQVPLSVLCDLACVTVRRSGIQGLTEALAHVRDPSNRRHVPSVLSQQEYLRRQEAAASLCAYLLVGCTALHRRAGGAIAAMPEWISVRALLRQVYLTYVDPSSSDAAHGAEAGDDDGVTNDGFTNVTNDDINGGINDGIGEGTGDGVVVVNWPVMRRGAMNDFIDRVLREIATRPVRNLAQRLADMPIKQEDLDRLMQVLSTEPEQALSLEDLTREGRDTRPLDAKVCAWRAVLLQSDLHLGSVRYLHAIPPMHDIVIGQLRSEAGAATQERTELMRSLNNLGDADGPDVRRDLMLRLEELQQTHPNESLQWRRDAVLSDPCFVDNGKVIVSIASADNVRLNRSYQKYMDPKERRRAIDPDVVLSTGTPSVRTVKTLLQLNMASMPSHFWRHALQHSCDVHVDCDMRALMRVRGVWDQAAVECTESGLLHPLALSGKSLPPTLLCVALHDARLWQQLLHTLSQMCIDTHDRDHKWRSAQTRRLLTEACALRSRVLPPLLEQIGALAGHMQSDLGASLLERPNWTQDDTRTLAALLDRTRCWNLALPLLEIASTLFDMRLCRVTNPSRFADSAVPVDSACWLRTLLEMVEMSHQSANACLREASHIPRELLSRKNEMTQHMKSALRSLADWQRRYPGQAPTISTLTLINENADSTAPGMFLTNLSADTQRPSLFELVAQEQLMAALHPAFVYIVSKLARGNPRLSMLRDRADAAFFLVLLLLERAHLHTYDGSFGENFYGLKRVVTTGRNRRLRRRDRRLALMDLILLPYLRTKLEKWYQSLRDTVDVEASSVSEELARVDAELAHLVSLATQHDEETVRTLKVRQRTLKLQRLINKCLRLYVKVYPVLHLSWHLTKFLFYVAYLFDRSETFSLTLMLIGQKQQRLSVADQQENQRRQFARRSRSLVAGFRRSGVLGRSREVFSRINVLLASYAKRIILAFVYGFKFLEWFYSSENELRPNKKLPVPPPPGRAHAAKEGVPLPTDRSLCPLCRRRRTAAAAIESGVVYCYSCIAPVLKRTGHCPVTLLPCTHVVRLFD
ncbi:MAG: hypothetical protein MHM6MM_000791 [Cercozoa sp. M6MM]